MKEEDFARNVGRHLDAGLDELPPSVLYRLRAARDTALARAQERQADAAATGGSEQVRGHRGWVLNRRMLAPLAVALLAVLGAVVWQQQAQQIAPELQADYADVDTQVLTDELPVVAYLDPGFEIWLYHQPPATAED
jgi:Protein of unknown function (DUF3619)